MWQKELSYHSFSLGGLPVNRLHIQPLKFHTGAAGGSADMWLVCYRWWEDAWTWYWVRCTTLSTSRTSRQLLCWTTLCLYWESLRVSSIASHRSSTWAKKKAHRTATHKDCGGVCNVFGVWVIVDSYTRCQFSGTEVSMLRSALQPSYSAGNIYQILNFSNSWREYPV